MNQVTEKSEHFHTCAVCTRRIPASMLMCRQHWKLVPPPLATAVYRDWHALQRTNDAAARARVLGYYSASRNAAVEAVQATLKTGAAT